MVQYSYIILEPLPALGSHDDIRRTLDLLKGWGYQGIELNLTPALYGSLDPLRGWLAERRLALPSFLTGEAYSEGLCLASPDPAVRERTVARLIEYLDAAKQFQAVLVVGMLQGQRRDEPDPQVARFARRIVECLREVATAAERKGVDVVIEPVEHKIVSVNNTVAEVRQLIQAIGSPAFFPMVDTVHMNVEERSLTEPIYECGPTLRHVHLCESNGGVFGTGRVDFGSVLSALRDIQYDRFASVKVYLLRKATLQEGARSGIDYLRRTGGG